MLLVWPELREDTGAHIEGMECCRGSKASGEAIFELYVGGPETSPLAIEIDAPHVQN